MNNVRPVAKPDDHRLGLLMRILASGGVETLAAQAAALDMPLSTAYRLVDGFLAAGLVARVARGIYGPGFELARLTAALDRQALLAAIARPHLRRLARQIRLTVHLGVLDAEMVTYLVKERGGGPPIFTQPSMQLEAYCSAIGKMLLASLPEAERERYIAAGPFIALTPRTITAPELLRAALSLISTRDHAIDDEEVAEGLRCIAVPVRDRRSTVVAAISVTRLPSISGRFDDAALLTLLRGCARSVEARL